MIHSPKEIGATMSLSVSYTTSTDPVSQKRNNVSFFRTFPDDKLVTHWLISFGNFTPKLHNTFVMHSFVNKDYILVNMLFSNPSTV